VLDIPETLAIREVMEGLESGRHHRICTMIMEGFTHAQIRRALHLTRFKLHREMRAIRAVFVRAGFETLHVRCRRSPLRMNFAGGAFFSRKLRRVRMLELSAAEGVAAP
jgi:hypothetical protein